MKVRSGKFKFLLGMSISLVVGVGAAQGSFADVRKPASAPPARLSEKMFSSNETLVALIWIRLDYTPDVNTPFALESHVVASPSIRVDRRGAISSSGGRFISIAIKDEEGNWIENLEIENPQLTFEPLLANTGKIQPKQDHKKHSYILRVPIQENSRLFKDVMLLDTMKDPSVVSDQQGAAPRVFVNKTILAEMKQLQNVYVEPAIQAVANLQTVTEDQKGAIHQLLAAYFENPDNLGRLRAEALQVHAKVQNQEGLKKSGDQSKATAASRKVSDVDILSQVVVRDIPVASANGSSTQKNNRLKLVIFGDGFQQSEMEAFFSAAQDKTNYLFGGGSLAGTLPLVQYGALFDVKAVFVPSNQSGACHPENKTPCPDTAFGVTFNVEGIQRLMGMSSDGYKVYEQVLRSEVPDYDLVAMISNDPVYGGAGGIPAITSLDSSASDIIAHELFGHSFAHLGDEYTAAYPGYPDVEEPNTIKSPGGSPANPKWGQWIGNNPPEFDKTPNLQVQAPVQGAHYHDTGWYRPATNCKMSTYGVPFCPVCSEAVIRSIYSKIKPIDSVSPAAGTVDTSNTQWSLNVLTAPATDTLKIEWSVNGKRIDLNAPIFNQDALSAAISQDSTIVAPYQVQVKVSDTTDLVSDKGRADGLLQETVTWNLK